MSARVLVVDDVPANIRLLEVKLHSEYYEVLTANNGAKALEAVKQQAPDIVLLDVMMPGMDGFEVCRRIKTDPETAHIPVVMVTALSDASDRVQGLEAGADDFLTKPAKDVVLFARIRSLVRMKRAGDEWRTRETTLMNFGGTAAPDTLTDVPATGRILLAMEQSDLSDKIETTLSDEDHELVIARDCAAAITLARSDEFQLVLVDNIIAGEDALRLCSQLRSEESTRHWPILLIVEDGDTDRLAKALELGVTDYLVRPVIQDELIARARIQIRRKWYEDALRKNYEESVAAAVTDSLTGLHNRRYLEAHFVALERDLVDASKPISLIVLDVDHFKQVNDSHGHAVGDELLKGLAERILSQIRGFDTAVRYGGEEFVVLMPNTPQAAAEAAADRLCQGLGATPYQVSGGPGEIAVTVSIGLASMEAGTGTLEDLIQRADGALYRAKEGGRNQVVIASEDGEEAPRAVQKRAVS